MAACSRGKAIAANHLLKYFSDTVVHSLVLFMMSIGVSDDARSLLGSFWSCGL